MPFSDFNYAGRWLEVRDSRLADILIYCNQFLMEFVVTHGGVRQLSWLVEAVNDWQTEVELPPGCKLVLLDKWLTTEERCRVMRKFFVFVGSKVASTMPPTEGVIVSECKRLEQFLLEV